jgi:hypothetical protein
MQHSCFQIVQNLQQINILHWTWRGKEITTFFRFCTRASSSIRDSFKPFTAGTSCAHRCAEQWEETEEENTLLKDTIQKMQEEKEDETK